MKTTSTTSTSNRPQGLRPAFAALVFSIAALAPPQVAVSAKTIEPQEFIRTLTDRALSVLRDDALDNEQKALRLESDLGDCCDFATTAKLVLARNWKQFAPAQQEEFVGLFKDYLVANYRKNIDGYAGETVEITGGREESRGDYTVRTRILRAGQDEVLVDYRLRKTDSAQWLIIDIIAEGISLVSNLRSQFQEIYTRDGADGILKAMRAKISNPE